MDRVLQSAQFKGSGNQRKLLGFIVTEALAGRSTQLKGDTIAVAVYGRKAGLGDPEWLEPVIIRPRCDG